VTLTENACASPTRTAAVAGDVATAGWTLPFPLVKPAHPAVTIAMRQRETVQKGKRLSILHPRTPPPTRFRRNKSAAPLGMLGKVRRQGHSLNAGIIFAVELLSIVGKDRSRGTGPHGLLARMLFEVDFASLRERLMVRDRSPQAPYPTMPSAVAWHQLRGAFPIQATSSAFWGWAARLRLELGAASARSRERDHLVRRRKIRPSLRSC